MKLRVVARRRRVRRRRSCVNCCASGCGSSCGSAGPGDLACARDHGPDHLVADELERAPGHRRPVRCRGGPRFRIPDDENAFTFFRRANEKLSPCPAVAPGGSFAVRQSPGPRPTRSSARGSRRIARRRALPAGSRTIRRDLPPAGEPYSGRYSEDLGPHHLTCWPSRGQPREASGDMAGAWDCYRAVLLATVHGAAARDPRRALFCRCPPRMAEETARDLGGRPQDHDPPASTRPGGGRRGPAEARVACVLAQDGISRLMRVLERPTSGFQRAPGGADLSSGRYGVAARPEGVSLRVRRFLLREPERSRRAIRLLFANWLAEVEAPGPRQRKPAARATFFHARHSDACGSIPSAPTRRPPPVTCRRTNWHAGWSRPPTSS